MNTNKREELANAYFNALDVEIYERLKPVVSDDLVYQYPGQSKIKSIDNVIEFLENERPTSETTHKVIDWYHTEHASVCEGKTTGKKNGKEYSGSFCDVFKFNENDTEICSIHVYSGSA